MSDQEGPTIDQQFIEYVVKSLVSNPDAVIVDRIIDEKGVLLTLTVDPEDLGRVIGKRGATAQSLRTLLRALGTKQESRFNLKIFDNGVPKPDREEQKDRPERPVRSEKPSIQEDKEETQTKEDIKAEAAKQVSAIEEAWSSSETSESSAAEDAANASGEEESAIERTRRELEELDDLDV
ncbi:MAG: putative RNA-binding protein YlqC (UPF0109 family) [Candidatus Saccharimonadales bacterium]|jgi:predicted RNA-binding protein YlqC (UPF0109 family)